MVLRHQAEDRRRDRHGVHALSSNARTSQIITESRDDGIACPYVIHTRPISMRPQHQKNKLHWAAINPEYLSMAFAKARDTAGVGADLQSGEKPAFHEIRSLGSRLLRGLG